MSEHDLKFRNEPDFEIYHFINIVKLNINYVLRYNLFKLLYTVP